MKSKIVCFLGMLLIFMACGGDDDPMTPSCDTLDMTYTDDIASIFNSTCAIPTCHAQGATSPELHNYAAVKLELDGPDRIVGAIKHEDGFVAMPFPSGSDMISDCRIAKIEAWVNDGAPE